LKLTSLVFVFCLQLNYQLSALFSYRDNFFDICIYAGKTFFAVPHAPIGCQPKKSHRAFDLPPIFARGV